jgi:hypothetical protein
MGRKLLPMSAWESFKAGLLGALGVDYYSKKTRDEVRGLRQDNRARDLPNSDPDAIQRALLTIHEGVVELDRAMRDTTEDPDRWYAVSRLAFVDLVAAIDRVEESYPIPAGDDPDTGRVFTHYRRATSAFREGARLWHEDDIDGASQMVVLGKGEWNALSDEVDRLTGQ